MVHRTLFAYITIGNNSRTVSEAITVGYETIVETAVSTLNTDGNYNALNPSGGMQIFNLQADIPLHSRNSALILR